MKQPSGPARKPAEAVIKDIRRAARRQFSAEDRIRIVLEGLRGEDSIAELCLREGIASSCTAYPVMTGAPEGALYRIEREFPARPNEGGGRVRPGPNVVRIR